MNCELKSATSQMPYTNFHDSCKGCEELENTKGTGEF